MLIFIIKNLAHRARSCYQNRFVKQMALDTLTIHYVKRWNGHNKKIMP